MDNNFSTKFPTVNFTVKNVSSQKKSISIFGLSIPYLRAADLMSIKDITEADIKSSLTKGELASKIKAGDIKILSSTLNLLEFNDDFRNFIGLANIDEGQDVAGTNPYTQVGSGGGGGGVVIEDGGTLGGNYDGDVLCKGNVTINSHTLVNGNLTVLGTCTNYDRYELIVKGDLHANFIDFTSNNANLVQSNFTVDGDLFCNSFNFPQCGGSAVLLRVGGNFTGINGFLGTILNGEGLYDTPGLNVLVCGDITCSNIKLQGGDSYSGVAGNGGSLVVYGDLNIIYELKMYGGDAISTGYDAGYGGTVQVYGNLTMSQDSVDVNFNGGSAIDANAGNGGDITVHGNCILTNNSGSSEFYGGDCQSGTANHRAGSGGYVTVYGNLVCDSNLELGGGYRSGTLSETGSNSPAYGGSLFVGGHARVDQIDVDAGTIDTANFAPCSGGNAGDIIVYGNLVVVDTIYGAGAYSAYSDGGSGSDIDVHGDLITDSEIKISGGYSNSGNGGSGGYIYVKGNCTVRYYIDMYGGNAIQGYGGNGGSIEVIGNLKSGNISADGGNCDSTNENHRAGNGGSVVVGSFSNAESNVYIDPGERIGATTVSNTYGPAVSQGTFICNGNCTINTLYAGGSMVDTDYPNVTGGNGTNVVIRGNLFANVIDISGGDSIANTAGRGGSLEVKGNAVMVSLNASGGGSYNSVLGSDAAANGAGPDSIMIQGGMNTWTLSLNDGNGDVGSTPPPNPVSLILFGTNTISNIEMTDRANCFIAPTNAIQCILKLGALTGKHTLNDNVGTASSDISSSLGDYLYISEGSTWFNIAGNTIFP